MNAPRISGTNCTRLTAPTCRDECVSVKTSKAIATRVSWLPMTTLSWPAKSSRKSPLRRNGLRSIHIRWATPSSCNLKWT
jgi:hypothetical protein